MLAGRTVESLLDMPEMADPEKRALVDVLFKTNASAFMAKPQASVLIGLKAVRLAIEHGNAPKSPYFYGNYGIINNATGGALDVSYRFAKLGIDLVDKAGYTEIEGATHFLFGAFNCHWRRPLSESLDHLRHAVKAALEAGAYLHVAWAAMILMYYRFYRGENIQELLADVPQTMDLLRRAENPAAQTILRVFERNLRALSGQTGEPDQPRWRRLRRGRVRRKAPRPSASLHVYYHVLKQPTVFLAGELPAVARARRDGVADDAGHVLRHGACALSHAGADRLARARMRGGDRAAGLELLRKEEETFRTWAEASPSNHAHRHALVAAEIAALAGEQDRAIDLYDQAIKLARESGFIQHEALASELAAKFHLRRQRTQVARGYMQEAWYAYRQWGANAKVKQLGERYAEPPRQRGRHRPRRRGRRRSTTATSVDQQHGLVARAWILVSAVRATQALAGELELGSLLERLMRVMVENAGAQKGILVLNHGGQLEVEALITVEPYRIQLGMRQPVERSRGAGGERRPVRRPEQGDGRP